MVELWALRDGLLLCQQLNSPKIIVEMDAKSLVDAINNPNYLMLSSPLSLKIVDSWFPKFPTIELSTFSMKLMGVRIV